MANGESDIQQRLVNQMLQLIGNPEYEGVYIVAATNYPWQIDAALIRKGRIGDKIYLPLPNYNERIRLFEYYTDNIPLDYKRLAGASTGFTPSDIAAIVKDAKLEKIGSKNYSKLETDDIIQIIKKEYKISVVQTYFARIRNELQFKIKGKKVFWDPKSPLDINERKIYIDMLRDIRLNGTPNAETRNAWKRKKAIYFPFKWW